MTCGINASLQCLLHTLELTKQFRGLTLSENYHGILDVFKNLVNIDNIGQTDVRVKPMLEFLRDVVRAKFPDKSKLTDSNEVLLHLLLHICPSIFRVAIKSQVSCDDCGTRSEMIVHEYLTLPFPPARPNRTVATLDDALQNFQTAEHLSIGNLWRCPTCKTETSSEKQLILDNLPNVFIIHLKRFENTGRRIDRMFDVPPELHFGHGVFRLYATICHYPRGVGHFVAYCRPNPTQPWTCCDDVSVTNKEDAEVLNDIKRNGYVFFFERQPSASVSAITQDVRSFAAKSSQLQPKVASSAA
jgi:ubiquitin C-terminal hydrolase